MMLFVTVLQAGAAPSSWAGRIGLSASTRPSTEPPD